MYASYTDAQEALDEAARLCTLTTGTIDFNLKHLDYKKIVCLCNYRDYSMYIKNPIYLQDGYFSYYLTPQLILLFDNKDLLFFSTYKIYKRGQYLYTQDSVSQQSILSRLGLPMHSIPNRDYRFKNGNCYDFRRSNLEIINNYKGVQKKERATEILYIATIYTDKTITIGHYKTEVEAAIAYNKAIDILSSTGQTSKEYIPNFIPFITRSEYNAIYNSLSISPRLKAPEQVRKYVLKNNKTYRGVATCKSGYRALIGYKGKQIYLGIYPTEQRAAQAYNYASLYLFGKNGYINHTTPLIHDPDMIKIANHLSKCEVLKHN